MTCAPPCDGIMLTSRPSSLKKPSAFAAYHAAWRPSGIKSSEKTTLVSADGALWAAATSGRREMTQATANAAATAPEVIRIALSQPTCPAFGDDRATGDFVQSTIFQNSL